ncbi:18S rRNA pseudouridine methyltransferase [Chamberlinius hualienensis]
MRKRLKVDEKRLIVILERANLETVKVGKKFELLNCDDHQNTLRKSGRGNVAGRPDIVHQCLLMLLDSPLNRAGLLQIYVHTERNVLIEINPKIRIPRTLKRFSGVIEQLLRKFAIRAADRPEKLMKVIKNPATEYFPAGSRKYGTSFSADKLVHPRELIPKDEPVVVVIGAMAHGQVEVDYTEEVVSFSRYPLSAAVTCSKLCTAAEEVWDVK